MSLISKAKRILIPRWLRLKHEQYLAEKEYKKMLIMPDCEYETDLVERYAQMMDRFNYSQGMRMDFSNPVTYTQKQQWLKLYDQSEKKTLYSDKYAVRQHIIDTIGEEYLIPLNSIDGKDHFYDANEIDYDKLPNSFVMKCNHGSHYNIIVKDKSQLTKRDIKAQKKQLNKWLKERYAFKVGLELVYDSIIPCITIEEYVAMDDDLPDYKFMCFSGEVKYVWVDTGRFVSHRRTLFDLNYQKMPFNINTYPDVVDKEKPKNFEKMVEIAQVLCEDFSFVRVDLYNMNGKIRFGELTFSSGAGFEPTYPIDGEAVLGEHIKIDQRQRETDCRYRNSSFMRRAEGAAK